MMKMQINGRDQRAIFESAYNSMIVYGRESMMSQKILSRRDEIESSMIRYYEQTEEFEKCKFILDFFKDLEETLQKDPQSVDILES
jgi:hypothetical protein